MLDETFRKLDKAISTDEMRKLNYAVDGEKRAAKDVAKDWIEQKGF